MNQILVVACDLFELAVLIGFVSKTYMQDLQTSTASDSSLKPDVAKVMAVIDQRQKQLNDRLVMRSFRASLSGSKFAPAHMLKWVEAVGAVSTRYKRGILGHVVTGVGKLAEEVGVRCDSTGHLINDNQWLKGKCKRVLLEQFDRAGLARQAGDLHRAIKAVTQTFTQFFPGPATIEAEYEDVASASGVFTSARDKVSLIAHLHVCQGLSGQTQLDEAEALFKKDQPVPKPLKEFIANLNTRAQAAKQTPTESVGKRRRVTRKTSDGGPVI